MIAASIYLVYLTSSNVEKVKVFPVPSSPASQVKDGWPGYSLDLFTYPEHYHQDIDCVYIPHGVIVNR